MLGRMTRWLALAPLLLGSGCIGLTARGGAELQALPVGGAGLVEVRAGIDGGHLRLNGVGHLRVNGRLGEVAIGPEGCLRTVGWRTGLFCASVPIALGSERRQLSFGLSPTVTVGGWLPTEPRPARKSGRSLGANIAKFADQFGPALVPALGLGVHWRPVGPSRATPFLQLTFGGGIGRSNMYGWP